MVHEIFELAEKAGGEIEKSAQPVHCGGYSGYFSDLDGYLWEVAWSERWEFNDDGSLVIS
jgi:predicted lactoylglutathione lyase